MSAFDGGHCRGERIERASECHQRLLAQLPSWFGIPEANADYVQAARELPGLVARADDEPVGVLLHRRHFPEAAEIHLMAVSPDWHRRGIGTAMVNRLVTDLRRTECQLLPGQDPRPVTTASRLRSNPGVYRAAGFRRSRK